MADQHEGTFEREICAHLAARDWLHSSDDTGYDRKRALFPKDVFGWLEQTQPEQLAKVVKPDAPAAQQAKQREQVLDRLVKVLDSPIASGGGTLNVLRKGFAHVTASFTMCQFRPATSLNPATLARYGQVRVRVMQQVHYSMTNQNAIDLVLFVNGLPVATLELKTDFTQTVEHAIRQYKRDRNPKGEPLLKAGTRALVHFAVSNDEVWMTTRLTGEATRFLPFNQGDDGAAGNPLSADGSRTAYLWERVLQRDAWLNIIGRLLHVEHAQTVDPVTSEMTTSATLLFPRFHQWEAVTELVAAAREEGTGQRYLVQHSAGSGKTNSISWTAHALATLHDEQDQKVFDSVIVVTDRNVLDDQLADAIQQIEAKTGVVQTVSMTEASKVGLSSKSGLLAKALSGGSLIVVVTLQTFPFAMEEIAKTKALAGKRFAVIADEAHSSQTGVDAKKLKEFLTPEEWKELQDGGEVDTETQLAAQMRVHAGAKNISYFAFTATPKARTLELFGRPGPDGKPRPFHVYSMQQAIEEGFILDVLRNYTSYGTAFQVAQRGQKSGDVLVDETEAKKQLLRWVKLHPTNIAQKVAIIVEHFRANVAPLLNGHAKAMVVTDSRKAAVRYKLAIDKYIAKHGYQIGTLAAFSGSVDDTESYPEAVTEHSSALNPGLRRRDLRTAFASQEFAIMVVANKFQTGFDQPLLCGMYVDKRLPGLAAVQTLSRLNRIYPKGGKDTTYVLDFVNEPAEILHEFQQYYRDARLATETDPNLVHDLRAKLDASGLYTDNDVDTVAEAVVQKKGNNALAAAVGVVKQRWDARWVTAVLDEDQAEIDALRMFRKDVGTYVRLYDFMSQIIDYADTGLLKRAMLFRLLGPQLSEGKVGETVDLGEVELSRVKQIDKGETNLKLGTVDPAGLSGMTGAGSGQQHDPKMVKLEELLARINELFAGENFTHDQQLSWTEGLLRDLLANDLLVRQAEANSKAQFLDSPDLYAQVSATVLSHGSTLAKMTDKFFTTDGHLQAEVVLALGELVYLNAHGQGSGNIDGTLSASG